MTSSRLLVWSQGNGAMESAAVLKHALANVTNALKPEGRMSKERHPSLKQKSAPLTQAAIRRMIKESVDAAIAAEQDRHVNVGNDARGSGPVRGQDAAPVVCECTFAGFMKCNPTVFHGTEGAVKLRRWFEKTKSVFGISECTEGKKVKFASATLQGPALTWWNAKVATMGLETVKEYNIVAYTQRFNELALMCPRMVEPESVKVDAYIRGLTDNIKVAASDERLWKEEAEKWRTFKVGIVVCHKCGKVGHKARYCKEKSVATGANASAFLPSFDCGGARSYRNRCRRKVKQEE
ncbi:putative reverse transcriptase domain-containing protein [Tanacetum coccineum]